jgi:hypothetical protein
MRTDSLAGNTTLDMQPASTSDLWLWVVQTRSTSGWTTQVLPGAERRVRFAARPLDVRVMAVDRVGNTSAAVRVR